MENISQKDVEWLLQTKGLFRYNITPNTPPEVKEINPVKKGFRRLMFWTFLVFSFAILPFLVLIRLSVYLNIEQQLNGWTSLAIATGATIIVVVSYLVYLFRVVRDKKQLLKFSFGGASLLVAGFCLYGLMYVSSVNAKSGTIKKVYRSMHPILRVAVASTTLADSDLVITDIKRSPEDYARMGINLNERSLHFPQQDGFVHAIDLRTIGQSEVRNFILKHSLSLLGFQTIRHVGTADHLHVALPLSR